MSEEDYRAIAKTIEEVVGKDTLLCVKLLQGIKFYFDNKVNTIEVINDSYPNSKPISFSNVSVFSKDANLAMQRYTKQLNEESKKLKEDGKHCKIRG